MLKNNKGIITVSFLLVLIIILFFILSFFGLAMTFAHVSVSQYMSYSTARKYSLAGKGQDEQRQEAQEYYQNLRSLFFKPTAYAGDSGDWFIIPTSLETDNIGDMPNHFPDDGLGDRYLFHGAGFQFDTFVLEFQIPFLIENKSPSIPYGIFSFLGREPSDSECSEEFNKKRGDKIEERYGHLPGFERRTINEAGKGDNGC